MVSLNKGKKYCHIKLIVDIHLFYPIHLYKIQARPKLSGNIENSSKKYNPQPKTSLNYNYRHKMINNENIKEQKRWTRTIFEDFWGGSKRYTRGRQAFGIKFDINRQIMS